MAEHRRPAVRSKRATILKQILEYIDTGDYEQLGRYWLFGASSIWDVVDELSKRDSEREDDTITDVAKVIVSAMMRYPGRVDIASRTTLNGPPKFAIGEGNSLPPDRRRALEQTLRALLKGRPPDAIRRPSNGPDLEDQLDAACAEELIGKLPKMAERTSVLDDMGIGCISDANVQRYFEEAHRCYLYGFNIACAVLCRAIVESALQNRCDPRHIIEGSTPPGTSYFGALVDRAQADGLLTDDRPLWAIAVRDAGNDAIHNFRKFNQRWSGRLDEILLNTRKLLVDLYLGALGQDQSLAPTRPPLA